MNINYSVQVLAHRFNITQDKAEELKVHVDAAAKLGVDLLDVVEDVMAPTYLDVTPAKFPDSSVIEEHPFYLALLEDGIDHASLHLALRVFYRVPDNVRITPGSFTKVEVTQHRYAYEAYGKRK